MGVDYRLSYDFTAGVGVGFGHDESTLTSGSKLTTDGYTVAVYASYHPTLPMYVDVLLADTIVEFDSVRLVNGDGIGARGHRSGNDMFGFVSIGYDLRTGAIQVSPYLRVEGSRISLRGFSETGGGVYDLRYGRRSLRTATMVLGLRAQRPIVMGWGVLTPSGKIEYSRDFVGSSLQRLGYERRGDMPYVISSLPLTRDYLSYELGASAALNSWRLAVEYRGTAAKQENSNGVAATVAKRF
jgi:outer membrane autotransporter protein